MVQLRKYEAEARAKLEAWEKVTFPTKKDGTPFKIMSKNISGATYYTPEWVMQPGEYKLRVNAWCKESGYIANEIDAYNLVKYLSDDKKKAKTQNYQPKLTYMEQVYTYDLDDIKDAVAAKIEDLKAEIAEYTAQQAAAAKAYEAFHGAYIAAIDQLKRDTGKERNSALYYMILDTVKAKSYF